jgi:hypothetical protein
MEALRLAFTPRFIVFTFVIRLTLLFLALIAEAAAPAAMGFWIGGAPLRRADRARPDRPRPDPPCRVATRSPRTCASSSSTSAPRCGSLSSRAHTQRASSIGGPDHRGSGGDTIWEIASGCFGCRTPDDRFDPKNSGRPPLHCREGMEGRTGAPPLEFADQIRMPLREEFVFVRNALTRCGR